jgi:hypothetical protein
MKKITQDKQPIIPISIQEAVEEWKQSDTSIIAAYHRNKTLSSRYILNEVGVIINTDGSLPKPIEHTSSAIHWSPMFWTNCGEVLKIGDASVWLDVESAIEAMLTLEGYEVVLTTEDEWIQINELPEIPTDFLMDELERRNYMVDTIQHRSELPS